MSSQHDEIIRQLGLIAADQFALDPASITDSTRLSEDLDMDSLDALQLTCAVEYCFSIAFDDGELDDVTTVGEAAEHIAAHLGLECSS